MGRKRKKIVLKVFMNGLSIGLLTKDSAASLSFAYSPLYLKRTDDMPISNSLPLREEIYRGEEVSCFFDNLLPDNEILCKKIARQVGAESSGSFDLLHAIGRDCIGGLQLLPESEEPLFTGPVEAQGKNISKTEVAKLLKNLTHNPLGLDVKTDFRISIAGVHEKTALLHMDNKWFLPRGATPTTHILKPPIGILPNGIDLSTSVENEWLCLQICGRLGLPVTQANIKRFEGKSCLIIERFDRQWLDGKRIVRLPQEDLCQALGFSPTLKYESDGGPGIVPIMEFLNASNKREDDRMTFLKAHIIFQLIGATDGHAKNFSLFLSPKGMQMTPLYDILTIYPALAKRQIEPKEIKMAMSVGHSKKYRLREIFRRHWEQTAKQAGFHKDYLDTIFHSIHKALIDLETNPIKLPRNFPDDVFETIMQGIQERKSQLF